MIKFDTHIHIDLFSNRKAIIDYINYNNIYCIAVTNLPTIFKSNRIKIKETKYIRHALGYHPELVEEYPDLLSYFKKYINETRYIGEIGLDGSSKYSRSFIEQKAIFSQIISLCDFYGDKILTIHSRQAEDDVLEILNINFNGTIILHWYTGSVKNLKIAIDRDYYFSINHKMIKTNKGKEMIKLIPISRLLIESDAPFSINNKWDYFKIYEQIVTSIANIKKLDIEIVVSALDNNFKNLIR